MINLSLKERLREEFLLRRSRMPFEEVYRLSLIIQRRFISMDEFCSAKRLALYASFKNEVITDDIFLKAVGLPLRPVLQREDGAGKEVYFPRVVKNGPHLAFYRVKDKMELSEGSYNILEPPADNLEIAPALFDCIVLPGVAFDMRGNRIGYGKGYYDRILGEVKGPKVALAFDFQLIEKALPVEDHDIGVDLILTEKGIVRI